MSPGFPTGRLIRRLEVKFSAEMFMEVLHKILWCITDLRQSRYCQSFHHYGGVQSNLSLRPPDKSDHLKIADTHFQSLQFADSNVRSAFLKMLPPEKCELRTPEVGPKLWFNLGKATTYVKLSKKHFFDYPAFPSQALRTSDHRVCKILLVWL